MTVSFFTAALSTWRVTHAPLSGAPGAGNPAEAVVKLSIKAAPGARTAETLGAEREGTGVVIGEDGLVVTIGYLILEADSILVVTPDGRVFPATVVGYDHATGFGLLRTSRGIARAPLAIGDSSEVRELAPARVGAHAAAGGVSHACVVGRRRFTGWWEYMIEGAIFTSRPRYEHSGAALVDASGRLVDTASLWVGDSVDQGVAFPGNMFVPIDLLKPVLDDLVALDAGEDPAPRPRREAHPLPVGDDAGQQVSDEGREFQPRRDEAEHHRQTESGGDGRNEIDFVWHGPPSSIASPRLRVIRVSRVTRILAAPRAK